MKIRNNLTLRKIGRKYMIVEASDSNVNLTDVYTLNETAAFLWKSCGNKDFTAQDLVKDLMDTYEVSEEQATADVNKLLEDWKQLGLLNEN